MAGGTQRKVSGPQSPRHGKIIGGGIALIGQLMAQDGDYLEKFSTYGGSTSGFASARRGVLVSGSQDGHQADDRTCMCDMGGEWRFPLDSAGDDYYPSGTLVAAVGNETVSLLTAGNESEAIGELTQPVNVGDAYATFRFYEKEKTS